MSWADRAIKFAFLIENKRRIFDQDTKSEENETSNFEESNRLKGCTKLNWERKEIICQQQRNRQIVETRVQKFY